MRRAIQILLVIAVLWCGLHLPPAETDAMASSAIADAAHAVPDSADDSAQPHGGHGCHSHCPLAANLNSGPSSGIHAPIGAPHFASRIATLTSAAQAPPVEPPAA